MAADPRTLAETYFSSWAAKDFATLRTLLSDDVTFRGPMGTADDIESCLKGLQGMAELMTGLEVKAMVADGDDVITWFEIETADTPPMPTANWSRVRDGKISQIRATFDPRPLTG